MKAWEKLRDWLESVSDVRTRAWSEAEVAAIEAKRAVAFPEDYRAFLLNAAPARDDDMDDEFGSWWTPVRMLNVPANYDARPNVPDLPAREAASCLIFLDHLAWCWAWAICCAQGEHRGRVVLLTAGLGDRFVADDFTEFVDRYLTDWSSLC